MTKKKTNSKLLIPPKNGLAVRMYRHGLGDCFLLAFDKSNSKTPCYVLIDCGVHMRQDKGSKRLGEVMTNLIGATGGKLDVVVVSHEHADHLSGFVQKGSPFINSRIEVDRFWVAWTEKVGDPQADRLRRKRGAARKIIQKAVEKIRKRGIAAFADQLTGLLDFESLATDTPLLGAKAKTKKRASSNEVALEMLKQNADKVEYCEPGETLKLPGVRSTRARVYVLGPPRDEVLLKRDKPAKGASRETYLAGRAEQRTFIQAPALHLGEKVGPRKDDLRHPFEWALRRECRFDVKGSSAPWRTRCPAPPEIRPFYRKNYFSAAKDWRRIDTEWLDTAEQLALDLNNDTNNTSLTLAFELGTVKQGHVFLFVGDAQVGNWLSWRSQKYKANRRTSSADDLLARTVLYKVGHHGSHNATVRRDPLHTSTDHPQGEPFGLELMPSGLTALIPVDQAAVRKRMPTPWHMPHSPLYKRLLEKADRRVLRSDGLSPRSEGISLSSRLPRGSNATPAPGLDNVEWRRSSVKFTNGRKCQLYYDLLFEP
ncbi:MAG: MBL fold metallo-hydrolase [Phycisphaerae bacterium]|nr:MBL fold metallo-hydrolase [Phycisphaerae bacterium]